MSCLAHFINMENRKRAMLSMTPIRLPLRSKTDMLLTKEALLYAMSPDATIIGLTMKVLITRRKVLRQAQAELEQLAWRTLT